MPSPPFPTSNVTAALCVRLESTLGLWKSSNTCPRPRSEPRQSDHRASVFSWLLRDVRHTSEWTLTATHRDTEYQLHFSDGENEPQRGGGTFPTSTDLESSMSIQLCISHSFPSTGQIFFYNIDFFSYRGRLKL